MVAVDAVSASLARSEILKTLASYRVGQVVDWDGIKVRVIDILEPNDYRPYGVVDVEPVKPKVPARAYWVVTSEGVRRRVPEGWRE